MTGENLQPNPALCEVVNGVDEVPKVASKAIQLPNDQRVIGAERLQAGVKTGAIIALSGSEVLVEQFGLDASFDECIALQIERLRPICLRNARVSNQHPSICHLNDRLCDR